MSQSELNRFLKDLESNDALRGAVEALRPAGASGTSVPAEGLLALAKQQGYEVSMDDLAAQSAELDESDLEAVAAGALRSTTTLAIGGESKDAGHDKWIDVLSIDWGAHKPGGG